MQYENCLAPWEQGAGALRLFFRKWLPGMLVFAPILENRGSRCHITPPRRVENGECWNFRRGKQALVSIG